MQRQPVKSSNIASVGYDEIQKIVEVEFKTDGSIYQYRDVPEDIWITIMTAPSIGSVVHSILKKNYKYTKVN